MSTIITPEEYALNYLIRIYNEYTKKSMTKEFVAILASTCLYTANPRLTGNIEKIVDEFCRLKGIETPEDDYIASLLG